MDYAYQFVIDNHGIDTEDDYPYQGRGRSCKKDKVIVIFSLIHVYTLSFVCFFSLFLCCFIHIILVL